MGHRRYLRTKSPEVETLLAGFFSTPEIDMFPPSQVRRRFLQRKIRPAPLVLSDTDGSDKAELTSASDPEQTSSDDSLDDSECLPPPLDSAPRQHLRPTLL